MEKLTPTSLKKEYVNAVWAVDPSEKGLCPESNALMDVKQILGGSFEQVHPIYICNHDNISLDDARKQIQTFLDPLNLGPTFPAEVYRSPAKKRKDRVERILNLAHSQKSQVILLTSHGRSAVGAFFLGSFARELLQRSEVPVLFLCPHKQKVEKSKKVLFTTDFSEASQKAFANFLKLVRDKVSEVIVCHVVSFPTQNIGFSQADGSVFPTPDHFYAEQKEWAEREMEHLLAEAKKMEVNPRFQSIVEESMTSAASAIRHIAERENVGLIGLVAHVGTTEGVVFGGVVQDLLASPKFNLWVCGPHFADKEPRKN